MYITQLKSYKYETSMGLRVCLFIPSSFTSYSWSH